MRVIRIDDDVWRVLQKRAVPLQDTPNSVLRRLLRLDAMPDGAESERGRRRKRRSRLRSGVGRTPQEALKKPILQALKDMGGKGRVADVLERLELKMKERLTPVDLERLSTGQVRWKNTAQWARNDLVEEGLVANGSPRGIWQITEKGKEFLNGTQ